MSKVGIKVSQIDLFSTILYIIKNVLITIVIGLLALVSAFFIVSISSKEHVGVALIIIGIVTSLWLFILYCCLTIKKPFIVHEVQMNKNGDFAFKYKNTVIKCNIPKEAKLSRLKVFSNNEALFVHLNNINNRYKVILYLDKDLVSDMNTLCEKYQIPIRKFKEDN